MKIITACPLDCPDSCSLEVTVELGKIVDIDAAPIGEEANPLTAGWICKKVKHHALRVYSKGAHYDAVDSHWRKRIWTIP